MKMRVYLLGDKYIDSPPLEEYAQQAIEDALSEGENIYIKAGPVENVIPASAVSFIQFYPDNLEETNQ